MPSVQPVAARPFQLRHHLPVQQRRQVAEPVRFAQNLGQLSQLTGLGDQTQGSPPPPAAALEADPGDPVGEAAPVARSFGS